MSTADSSELSRGPPPDSSTRTYSYVGAALAVIVAGIHVFHPKLGLPKLVTLVLADPALLVFDPRPLAFVVSGLALLVGLLLVGTAQRKRPFYLAGTLLATVYLVGYFAWHFTGHGGFLPGRQPLFHGLSPLENVLAHLTGDVLAAVSKASEVAMVGVLALLYQRE